MIRLFHNPSPLIYISFVLGVFIFLLIFGILNPFTTIFLTLSFFLFSFLNIYAILFVYKEKFINLSVMLYVLISLILFLVIIEEIKIPLMLILLILVFFALINIFYFSLMINNGYLRRFLYFKQILFFSIISLSLITKKFSSAFDGTQFFGINPLNFINAGLFGIGISWLFFNGKMVGIEEFRKECVWFSIPSLVVLFLGIFDLLMYYKMLNFAIFCGILGWIIIPLGIFIYFRVYSTIKIRRK